MRMQQVIERFEAFTALILMVQELIRELTPKLSFGSPTEPWFVPKEATLLQVSMISSVDPKDFPPELKSAYECLRRAGVSRRQRPAYREIVDAFKTLHRYLDTQQVRLISLAVEELGLIFDTSCRSSQKLFKDFSSDYQDVLRQCREMRENCAEIGLSLPPPSDLETLEFFALRAEYLRLKRLLEGVKAA